MNFFSCDFGSWPLVVGYYFIVEVFVLDLLFSDFSDLLADLPRRFCGFLRRLHSCSLTMDGGRQQVAESVPGWDGNPSGWRRYSRKVTWFVLGTKKASRRNFTSFFGPEIDFQVDWPGSLLAMSWSQEDFKGTQGVRLLLQRLAASPLVRKNLPNTSAVLNQYFNY